MVILVVLFFIIPEIFHFSYEEKYDRRTIELFLRGRGREW